MTCHECERWLQSYLDREPVFQPASLSSHLADCAECRSQWEAAEAMTTSLAKSPNPKAPRQLRERILGEVSRAERPAKVRRRWSWRVAGWCAAAAAIALITIFAGSRLRPNRDDQTPEMVQNQIPEQSVDNPMEALASLSSKLADQSKDSFAVVLAVATPIGPEDLGADADPAQRVELPKLEVADNLRSVGASAGRAFAFLTREFGVAGNFDAPRPKVQ